MKNLFLLLLVGLFAIACEDDDPMISPQLEFFQQSIANRCFVATTSDSTTKQIEFNEIVFVNPVLVGQLQVVESRTDTGFVRSYTDKIELSYNADQGLYQVLDTRSGTTCWYRTIEQSGIVESLLDCNATSYDRCQ